MIYTSIYDNGRQEVGLGKKKQMNAGTDDVSCQVHLRNDVRRVQKLGIVATTTSQQCYNFLPGLLKRSPGGQQVLKRVPLLGYVRYIELTQYRSALFGCVMGRAQCAFMLVELSLLIPDFTLLTLCEIWD